MKVSSLAVFGGLAALTSATYTEACNAEKTVTVTKTADAPSSVVTTQGSWVTSVDYKGAESTVYAYPKDSNLKKYCNVAEYKDSVVIKVYQVIVIIFNGPNGQYASTYTQNTPPTTTPSLPPPPASTTETAPGAAKTHKVDVGAFGELLFNPNQVDAAVGDVVEFNFLAKNHSVTQSEFATPCTFNNGFDTGFNQFNPQNTSGLFLKPFTVTQTKPTWFYCKQGGPPNHCGKGMVFGINPAGKMDAFIENAKAQKGGDAPASTTSAAPPAGTAPPAAITTVTVGLDAGKTLKFEPPFLKDVVQGTQIHFDFRALNHTLTESSFDDPCKKLPTTAIDTNFQNANKDDVPNLKPFDFTLDTGVDKPRWFYCKQANGTPNGHCLKGMVFAINPKSEEQFNEFVTKAAATLPKVKGRSLQLGQGW
ncbi:MAG: hypothetical protein M1825_004670 [Sarcosagium campestre]|nr:MAG: hypothetical protein M1825_004670 [Sarcosagium campestre]